MSKKLVLNGALDMKGAEYAFARDIVQRAGIETLIANQVHAFKRV